MLVPLDSVIEQKLTDKRSLKFHILTQICPVEYPKKQSINEILIYTYAVSMQSNFISISTRFVD